MDRSPWYSTQLADDNSNLLIEENHVSDNSLTQYQWQQQNTAAELVAGLLSEACAATPFAQELQRRLLDETGTRLVDWLDSIYLHDASQCTATDLEAAGFVSNRDEGHVWFHPGGIFPTIVLAAPFFTDATLERSLLTIQVDGVEDFSRSYCGGSAECFGTPGSPLRVAVADAHEGPALAAIERHGWPHFHWPEVSSRQIAQAAKHLRTFERRTRSFSDAEEGFQSAAALIDAAVAELGVDWACDLFFQAERTYWQSRNNAARIQLDRQQRLGLGWANHDHHTYRCSRGGFAGLIRCLEKLGFTCRERFYAGEEAGWGAQVLEQPRAGLVVFADVDMSPEEVTGDFAHEGLEPRKDLGTVGLWCALHGESFLQAGMHHLECQFDFDAARAQLHELGVDSMAPFTDFTFLRQAFTVGEIWTVEPARLQLLLESGSINAEQAEQFRTAGAVGSHLEILERNDGYKGFNQTGVSDIIARTDPRKVATHKN